MNLLKPSTLDFLIDLEKNNNKEWFNNNRKRYIDAKSDFESFIEILINTIEPYWSLQPTHAKDCIYRIFRDVRFSKDKTPYKTWFSATIAPGGKKTHLASVNIRLNPSSESFIELGSCHLDPVQLKSLRNEIDYGPTSLLEFMSSKEFRKIFGSKLEGEKLKTIPRGFDKDHPHADLLKHKTLKVKYRFPPYSATHKKFTQEFLEVFQKGYPFLEFINSAISLEIVH